MRSISLAFACIVAVTCGQLLARFGGAVLLGPLLAVAGVIGLAAAWGSDRGRAQQRVLAISLACVGLVRGASVVDQDHEEVRERGPASADLRVFEVVGAGEPGPRCTIVLRDGDSASIEVSAPPDACPCWQGQRLAIASSALSPSWEATVDDAGPDFDLGEGPVAWRRPATSRWFERPIDGYWRTVALLRQAGWESSRGDPAASMVVAVGLGLRSALPPEQREHLRASGLGHLIAVSGLNVAIAAVWLQFLARRGATLLGASPGAACALAWLPLWIYVGLTGSAPSAIRAAAMLTIVELGTVVGRPTHGPTTLAIVAAGMLLWQPSWLIDPGFGLSVAAMAVIVSAPRELGLLATSWRISCVTAPLSVLYFDVAPLHGLIGNVVALPLFGLLMPVALVACVVPGPPAELALAVGGLLATPILDTAELLATVPGVGALGLLVGGVLGSITWLLRPGPRLAVWLPPKLACGLAVVLAVASMLGARRDTEPAPPYDWIALGTVQSRSLLVADLSAPDRACLYRPTNDASTWRWLLEQHGVARLSRLDAALPSSSPARADPGTRALASQLERAGIEIGDGSAICRAPPPEQIRAALRACRHLQGDRGPALARVWAGGLRCRIEDRWVRLADGAW